LNEQVITNASELSEKLFEQVLKENGALISGAVRAFQVEPLKSENSNIFRVRLEYANGSTGSLPASLFLKMCGGANSHDFGSSEVEYYRRDYAGQSNLPLLKCYSAVYSAEKKSYHLLLEDLTGTHGPSWEKVSSGAFAYPVAEGLGRLHSFWWCGEDTIPAGLEWPVDLQVARFFLHMQPGPALLLQEIKDDLDADTLGLAKEITGLLPARLLERSKNPNGFTLVHGDLNPGNILSPDGAAAGPIYLIDRQPFEWSLTTWLGVSDLAYMLVLWLEPELRRKIEVEVVETYYASLRANGVTGYSREQLWQDYRLSVMQCLYIPFEWCILEEDRRKMHWLWSMEFQRVLTATRDLNCQELLTQPLAYC
jgi:hypothetical protein